MYCIGISIGGYRYDIGPFNKCRFYTYLIPLSLSYHTSLCPALICPISPYLISHRLTFLRPGYPALPDLNLVWPYYTFPWLAMPCLDLNDSGPQLLWASLHCRHISIWYDQTSFSDLLGSYGTSCEISVNKYHGNTCVHCILFMYHDNHSKLIFCLPCVWFLSHWHQSYAEEMWRNVASLHGPSDPMLFHIYC